MNKTPLCCAIVAAAMITGCVTPTTRVDINNDTGGQVVAIDYRDVRETVAVMLQDLFRSGRLDRTDGQMYVVAVGKVENDTPLHFNTDIITSYITEELTNSGKALVTAAVAYKASNRDEMLDAAASLRNDAEFDQTTVVRPGQRGGYTHSLFGKIIQQEVRTDNGDRRIEYYLEMNLTDAVKGYVWWKKQHQIIKNTDGRRRGW